LAGRLEFAGENLREVVAGTPENQRVRWTVSLRSPVSGKYFLTGTGMLPPPSTEVAAPAVMFEQFAGPGQFQTLQRQQAFVLLINASPGQLTAVDTANIEPVLPADLPIVLDD